MALTGDKDRLSWHGKEKDKESQLNDLGVRKYDDYIGGFTSTEPLWENYYDDKGLIFGKRLLHIRNSLYCNI
jgi:hypothetical protein